MATIFSKIIAGEIPSFKVAESDNFYAFLDIFPLKKGHTLVVPKKEIDYFFDVDDEMIKEYIYFTKKLAIAIKNVIPCIKVGMAVIGLEVPHAHIHLVPLHDINDLNFSNPKQKFSDEEFKDLSVLISEEFSRL
ncbi:MAG: HIT family protein [Deltaproteobacteria bacterium]